MQYDLVNTTNHICKDPISKYGHVLRSRVDLNCGGWGIMQPSTFTTTSTDASVIKINYNRESCWTLTLVKVQFLGKPKNNEEKK